MLISPAYAQAADGGLGGLGAFLPLILIFVVFYFLLIRPQQKKARTHREMVANLRRGDRIVTNGGLIGLITRVPNDTELVLEVADGVKVRVVRSMIADLLAKSQPVRDRGGDADWDEDENENADRDDGDAGDAGDDGADDAGAEAEPRAEVQVRERPPARRRRRRSPARSGQQRARGGSGRAAGETDAPEPADDRPDK